MRVLFVLVFVAGLGSLFWWGTQRGEAPRASALAGKPAPEISLTTLKPYRAQYGDTLDLADFIGKVPVVVNFWASWCPPCREEAPMLEAKWQKYQAQVQFYGVNIQDREQPALEFIEEFGLTFPSGADPQGRAGIDFGTYGLPETFFIDREGRIMTRHVGYLNAQQFEGYMEELLR